MYPVTQAYRDGMAGQIRGAVTAEGELLNVDAYVQGGMTVTSANALPGCSVAEISDPTADKLQEVATFEQDYLRTDGSQVFMDGYAPDYYIYSSLSAATPNADGDYPITAGISVAISADWSFGAQPVTIVFDEAAAHVSVELSYMEDSTEAGIIISYPVEDGTVVIPPPPAAGSYTQLTVTVTSLRKPNRRARIKKIYAGTRRLLTGNEIVSLKYSDENDGVGLELPSKTVALSIDNVGHQYTMETEYESPSFHKGHTQFIFRVGCDVYGTGGAWEWVPFPKMYLSSYQVNDETVDFTFTDAIGLLSEYPHLWSKLWNQAAGSRLTNRVNEVFHIADEIHDIGTDRDVQTEPERRRITLNTAHARNMLCIQSNPCPPVSVSQALQLYSNFSGNIFRSKRTGDDLEFVYIDTPCGMHIAGDEMFAFPAWGAEEKITEIETEYFIIGKDTKTEEAGTNLPIPSTGDNGFFTEAPIKAFEAIPDPYSEEQDIDVTASFAYAIYLRGHKDMAWGVDLSFTLYNMLSQKSTSILSYQEGRTLKLSNPLLDNVWLSDIEHNSFSYAEMMYDELKHNMSADLSHRGFPELDAGDVITFESETQKSVTGRVIKNEFEIKAGSMSGSTKVRRLS